MTKNDESSPVRRRALATVVVAGAAVTLGTGSYLTTTWIQQRGSVLDQETQVIVPVAPAASAVPSVAGTGSPSAGPTQVGNAAEAAMPATPLSGSAAERVRKAREFAAKNSHPVLRPITPAPGLPTGPVKVSNTGELKDGSTLRVVTATYDLSGQRELLWAADKGTSVGHASCTQNFRFSNSRKPKEMPSMLLCWRTSEHKSVVTVAVSRDGRPSKATSAAEIDRRWATLD
jgi:hypothetical protein